MRVPASILFLTALLATSVAATDFSLLTLETIEKSEVTSTCYTAYTAPIPDCNDTTKTCTAACVSALNAAATRIRTDCDGAFTTIGSVLRRTMDGGLVALVCEEIESASSSVDDILTKTIYPTATSDSSLPTDLIYDTRILTRTTPGASVTVTGALDLGPAMTAGVSGAASAAISSVPAGSGASMGRTVGGLAAAVAVAAAVAGLV